MSGVGVHAFKLVVLALVLWQSKAENRDWYATMFELSRECSKCVWDHNGTYYYGWDWQQMWVAGVCNDNFSEGFVAFGSVGAQNYVGDRGGCHGKIKTVLLM